MKEIIDYLVAPNCPVFLQIYVGMSFGYFMNRFAAVLKEIYFCHLR